MPAEPAAATDIDDFTVEAVGIPGRGLDDEEVPIAQANLDEDLFERGM